MAKRKRVTITHRVPRTGKSMRIQIPQTPTRPTMIHARTLVKRDVIRPSKWWWTGRRRGHRQIAVGEDPREARATPKSKLKGTLPERIIHKELITNFHQVEGIDFNFQTSLQGGRSEMGGIVADFIFPYKMWVFRIQGPTHAEFLREKKDEEQSFILEEMGYQIFDLLDTMIYDEYALERELRKIFNLYSSGMGSTAAGHSDDAGATSVTLGIERDETDFYMSKLERQVLWLEGWVANYV